MDDLKDTYINSLYAPETADMIRARKYIADMDFPIHISPAEGRLLQILIKMSGVKNCVEIGTLGGYSSLWISDALPQGGHLYTCEHDPKRLDMAKRTLSGRDNVTIVEGDANETLPALSEKHGEFDMVFIDADKISYLNYLDWAERSVKTGGLIVADDTLLKGSVYLPELPYRIRQSTCDKIKLFNKRLADPKKFDSILIPTNAGLTVAIKRDR